MPNSPRRRATPSKKRSKSASGFSTLALALGVVVAGLGIGALVSAFTHRGDERNAVNSATATPLGERTYTPIPVVVPTAPPTPFRRAARSPRPALETATPEPSASATAAPTTPTDSRSSAPTQTLKNVTPKPTVEQPTATSMRVVSAATPESTPPARATPSPTPRRASASAQASVAPVATATATALAQASAPDGESGFPQEAAGVVRRYLRAVIGGDGAAAAALLDASANRVSETTTLDASAKIASVHTRATGPNSAHVEADVTTSSGTYFASYDVAKTANGPKITQHELIKP